ncbi:hypothetical protein niasHT_013665 [Heterodera trifolii]|uniref:Uncharacterized protein n=1 Tax=Heterodera trifolii TaxID=157864 RepID=A0ABD2LGL5_9BILA
MSSNSFFVFLPSNVTDYPDNQPNKFRVRLPKPIYFNGSWVCGLHSISYPYSWHSTIGTLDDQWINIHFEDTGSDAVERQRVIRVPVPKGSHKKVEQLRDFIVATLRHQSSTIEQLKNETQTKSTSSNTNTFIERPRLLSPSSPPPSERRKRSLGETLTSPPTHKNTSQIPSSTSLPPLPVLKPVVNTPTIANTAPATEKVAKAVASGKQTDTTGSAPVSSAFPHKNIITNNQPNTNNKVASTKTPAPPPPLSATTTPKAAQSHQAVGAATKPKVTQSQQAVGAATKPKVTQSQQAAAAATTSTTITVNKATATAKPTVLPSPPVAPATTTAKAAKAVPVVHKELNENAAGVDVLDIMLGEPKQSVASGEEKQQQTPKTNVTIGRPLMSTPDTESKDVLDIMLGGPKQSIVSGEEKQQQQQPPKPNVTIGRPLVSPPPTESKDVLDIMLGEPKQSVVSGEEKQQQQSPKTNVTIGRPLMSPPDTEPKDVIDDLFGIVPKTGEKNRAQLFLNEMLGGSDEKEKGPPLELLKHIIDSVEIQYHLDFERFKIVFHDPAITGLSFSPQLGYVLGFEYPQNVRNSEIAKYGCDLRGGFSSFAVYSNGLTENMIIGNSLSSLLRVVSVTGAVSGEYNEKIYDSPIYARVLPREISEIEIELRTMDNGRLVPFAFGTTMVVLIFKKYGSGVLEDEKEMTVFKGSSPFQRGYGTQRGAGVGDVFRGLWRFFLPILRRVGTTVGTEALNTGQRVLERVTSDGAPLKQTLINEGKRGIDSVLEKEKSEIRRIWALLIKMAFHKIDNDSVNSITNALDLFNVPPTNVSVSSSKVFELLPSNPLTDTPYHFKLHSSQNFIDLSKCYLLTEFRIRKENENGQLVNLVGEEAVTPIQMIGQTFIRNIRMSINGREIFNSNALMAYKTYFSHELSYSTVAKDSHLNAAGYYRDTDLILEDGVGCEARRNLFSNSKTVQCIAKLDADLFNQPLYLVNFCELDVEILPNSSNFLIIVGNAAAAATRYHFEIVGLKMYVKKVSLMDGLALDIARKLEVKPARYAVRKTMMKSLFISQGRFEFNANLFMDQIPRRITLGLVANSDYVGDPRRSPFNFQPFNVREISIIANGRAFPQAPYDLDYPRRKYVRAFNDMNEAVGFSNTTEGNGITYAQFGTTHCIYVFNMTNSGDDQPGLFDLIRNGTTANAVTAATVKTTTVKTKVGSVLASSNSTTKVTLPKAAKQFSDLNAPVSIFPGIQLCKDMPAADNYMGHIFCWAVFALYAMMMLSLIIYQLRSILWIKQRQHKQKHIKNSKTKSDSVPSILSGFNYQFPSKYGQQPNYPNYEFKSFDAQGVPRVFSI